ncbi:hypothetical protein LI141_03460 [Bacteroides thetaiotaomicron]|nr:hypothetical protein [Bacteroides thetaiotaomicron]MCB7007641.1 hypothetical protein [Bacteroides thetaiotaomicron]MCB7363755.1 hypothetical protein [Bacteroides thetaiotaomicron]MCQ5019376.1 hypothetical protein [Bacteroides thetaiotaomicron]MCQ5107615.1 hypothetical protein [Bacteroides thetaiotaomicron]
MKHFTIFQGFYYAIAEMTEEEIVSTIGSFTYREKVEEIRRIFAEQGEKAANEKKKELPAIAFSASYLNPEKRNVPLYKNDAFQKVQKRRVPEKR